MQRRLPYEAFASAVRGRRQSKQAKAWNLPQSNHSPFGNRKAWQQNTFTFFWEASRSASQ